MIIIAARIKKYFITLILLVLGDPVPYIIVNGYTRKQLIVCHKFTQFLFWRAPISGHIRPIERGFAKPVLLIASSSGRSFSYTLTIEDAVFAFLRIFQISATPNERRFFFAGVIPLASVSFTSTIVLRIDFSTIDGITSLFMIIPFLVFKLKLPELFREDTKNR
jgi:hypothetical protein